MPSLKMIVWNDKVLGYSESKKILKNFAEQYELDDYTIVKIPDKEAPENIGDLIGDKEIRYDDFYATYLTEDIMLDANAYLSAITDRFVEVDNFIDEILEYVKLTPDEKDDVMILSNELHDAIMDLVGDESLGCCSYYSDYFDIAVIIKELITGDITITREPF